MKSTGCNDLGRIVEALAKYHPELINQEDIRHASVALILRTYHSEPEILFIERAASKKDPWSGQIAFPGGGKEVLDADLKQTAIRETLEEIGLSLDERMIIGRLDDQQGSNRNRALNLVISCFIFYLEQDPRLVLNYEVEEAFWTPIKTLKNPVNHFFYQTQHRHEPFSAIRLGQGSNGQDRVLWGLTYRFVQRLLELVQTNT